MGDRILSAQEFCAGVARYMAGVDPAWAGDRWREQLAAEPAILRAALGEGRGRSALDCACGGGGQAIPLAQLGWRVTGADIAETSLEAAARRAGEAGTAVEWRTGDMRELGAAFQDAFDAVVCCMALDNLTADEDIQRAVRGMFAALKPGAQCYLRQRDFDTIMGNRPRYEVREERRVPHGRVIRLEDWDYESESRVICAYVFLREDTRKEGYRWDAAIFRYRRWALRKAELERHLRAAGFEHIAFLPQRSPWGPYEVVASKPAG
jgi:ubiquinone/menaquinone biosynthesis C-methylase UbiE